MRVAIRVRILISGKQGVAGSGSRSLKLDVAFWVLEGCVYA